MDEKVIDIQEKMPHIVSKVICLKCLKRWIAVRPENVLLENMECPNCGTGYVIETGESVGNVRDEIIRNSKN